MSIEDIIYIFFGRLSSKHFLSCRVKIVLYVKKNLRKTFVEKKLSVKIFIISVRFFGQTVNSKK